MATRHGKERQLRAAFATVLGAQLVAPPDLDTDRFGTFTPETMRIGGAVDTARAKAHHGMAVAGLDHGLASEASYGPAATGLSWHEEILLFVDRRHGLEVLEGHRGSAAALARHVIRDLRELPPSVVAQLPEQALTVRPADSTDRAHMSKGLTTVGALRRAVTAAGRRAADGRVVVEPDLRAHHNPARQRVLTTMAWRLARRLATDCPRCGAPGFGRVDVTLGLPCAVCRKPTSLIRNEIHACAVCEHHTLAPGPHGSEADPGRCAECNP